MLRQTLLHLSKSAKLTGPINPLHKHSALLAAAGIMTEAEKQRQRPYAIPFRSAADSSSHSSSSSSSLSPRAGVSKRAAYTEYVRGHMTTEPSALFNSHAMGMRAGSTGTSYWTRSLWDDAHHEIFEGNMKHEWIDIKSGWCYLCQEPVGQTMGIHISDRDHGNLNLFLFLFSQFPRRDELRHIHLEDALAAVPHCQRALALQRGGQGEVRAVRRREVSDDGFELGAADRVARRL